MRVRGEGGSVASVRGVRRARGRAAGACGRRLRHCRLWLCRPRGRHRPRLLRPAQLSQRRCLNIISFALMLVRTKAYYFTSLPSAGAVCEKETFQLMKTRGESQHVSTSKLYACAHRVSLSSICDTRKWSQHNISKPSDKLALW